jgi:hypothetical protein
VTTSQLGTITGTNGAAQVTYAGHPFYCYAADKKPGDASRARARTNPGPSVDLGRRPERRSRARAGRRRKRLLIKSVGARLHARTLARR